MFSANQAARAVKALHCQAIGLSRRIPPGTRCSHNSSLQAPLLRKTFSASHKVSLYRRGSLQIRMVLTESKDLDIGTKAPDFKLPEPLTGKEWSLAEFEGSPLLVMFICNHCPFVVLLKEAIAALAKEYQEKGVRVVAISSNSVVTHPQDGPDQMAEDAKKFGYTFPYLYDESQGVAKAYKAACTPEFYVFDKALKLQYHGQFDDARPSNGVTVSGKDLRQALDDVLAGRSISWPIKRSIGCNIKWAPGTA